MHKPLHDHLNPALLPMDIILSSHRHSHVFEHLKSLKFSDVEVL